VYNSKKGTKIKFFGWGQKIIHFNKDGFVLDQTSVLKPNVGKHFADIENSITESVNR
jgi:hypothetical protein